MYKYVFYINISCVYDIWNSYLGSIAYMRWLYFAMSKKRKKKTFSDQLTHILTSDSWKIKQFFIFGLSDAQSEDKPAELIAWDTFF